MSTHSHTPGSLVFARLPVLLFAVMAFAQTAQPPAEMVSHDEPATFRSKVNLVLVPVVVRDSAGRAIGTLRQEDFQLFDRGKPQIITKFSVEKAGGSSIQIVPNDDAVIAGEKPASGAPPPVIAEQYTAYLFDDVHLNFGDLAHVRDAARRHLDTALQATDRASIYSTSGQTTLEFTDDHAKLNETLQRLQPRPRGGRAVGECPDESYYMADLIQNKNDTQALQAATLEAMSCLQLDQTQLNVAQQAARSAAIRALAAGEMETRLALSVLKNVVRRMSAMPGRRAIVLVSPGFLIPDLQNELTDIIDAAIRANVSISSLDARGLYTTGTVGDASQHTYSLEASRMKLQYERESAAAESDVLAEVAQGTNGTFFQNNNDMNEGFRRTTEVPAFSYLLGFSPQNLKLDGSYHKLKVTLKPPNKSSLQARRGYYAPKHIADPVEEARREVEEALFSREVMHDIPVELHTQFFKSSEVDAKLTILARVDLKHLQFRKADGRNNNSLTVVSGLFDRNGNYLQAIEKRVEMKLKDDTLENKVGAGITIKTSFDVKPGSYVVRLVVRDSEAKGMAAQNGAVEIPY